MFKYCPVVGNRCVFDLRWCDTLPNGRELITGILFEQFTFRPAELDLIELARAKLGTGRYSLGADPAKAPRTVDCSSFIQWVYAQIGMQIPRASIDQRFCGEEIPLDQARAGDLIFTTGPQNYFISDPTMGIGHVGLLTGGGTVIHSQSKRPSIEEISIEDFLSRERYARGVSRLLPPVEDRLILELASDHQIRFGIDVLRMAMRLMPIIPIPSQ